MLEVVDVVQTENQDIAAFEPGSAEEDLEVDVVGEVFVGADHVWLLFGDIFLWMFEGNVVFP